MQCVYRAALGRHRALLAICAFYVALVFFCTIYADVPVREYPVFVQAVAGLTFKMLVFLFLSGVIFFLRMLWGSRLVAGNIRDKIKHARGLFSSRFRNYLSGDRLPDAMMGMLIVFTIGCFPMLKALLPFFNPYSWDTVFAGWDKILHGGIYPHETVIKIVDLLRGGDFLVACYASWFPVMYATVGYVIFFEADVQARNRFLMTFLLSWVLLGTALGVALSSVGPLFYDHFYPGQLNPYGDFMRYMAQSAPHKIVLDTKKVLIAWHEDTLKIYGLSILAMPSMHVAMCWLMALYGMSRGRIFGAGMLAFCILMVLSTIYIGTHYAIDAYVSIVLVTLIWFLSGVWAKGKCCAGRMAKSV